MEKAKTLVEQFFGIPIPEHITQKVDEMFYIHDKKCKNVSYLVSGGMPNEIEMDELNVDFVLDQTANFFDI